MGTPIENAGCFPGFSGLYQNFLMTKNMLGYEQCYVIDSRTGTGGWRLPDALLVCMVTALRQLFIALR